MGTTCIRVDLSPRLFKDDSEWCTASGLFNRRQSLQHEPAEISQFAIDLTRSASCCRRRAPHPTRSSSGFIAHPMCSCPMPQNGHPSPAQKLHVFQPVQPDVVITELLTPRRPSLAKNADTVFNKQSPLPPLLNGVPTSPPSSGSIHFCYGSCWVHVGVFYTHTPRIGAHLSVVYPPAVVPPELNPLGLTMGRKMALQYVACRLKSCMTIYRWWGKQDCTLPMRRQCSVPTGCVKTCGQEYLMC